MSYSIESDVQNRENLNSCLVCCSSKFQPHASSDRSLIHASLLSSVGRLFTAIMADNNKLVIGFETNCVPDLNALLGDGEGVRLYSNLL